MNNLELENKIKNRGLEFFASFSGEVPSIFNKNWWTGKVLDWAMQNEHFKTQLFRFVDVLPCLDTDDSLVRHLDEYFSCDGYEVPAVLKWGMKSFKGKLACMLLAKTIRTNIEKMGRQFIIGENLSEAVKSINSLRNDNFSFTVDILGEATVSREEENQYQQNYLQLLESLDDEQQKWKGLGTNKLGPDWGHAPVINIAVKPTTLYSQANPANFDGSVQSIVERFVPLVAKAKSIGAFLCIDMEQYRYKDITLEVYKRLKEQAEFRDYPHFGIAIQSYLRDTDNDLADMLQWSRSENIPIHIRLVKGAYWDYEMILANQNGWSVPVYPDKAQTDAAFERHASLILKNHDICNFACASHNIRSIATVMEMARLLNVPEEKYEFQVLFGMGEPVRKGLQKIAGNVRLYCPFGGLIPGMAYLVRRLLENISNESFLRQNFVEGEDVEKLLQNPQDLLSEERKYLAESEEQMYNSAYTEKNEKRKDFTNQPAADFTKHELRNSFTEEITKIRSAIGKTWPLRIASEKVFTEKLITSVNPALPDEIVGKVCLAGKKEIDLSIAAASQALPEWRIKSAEERAEYLFSAAERIRTNVVKYASWQVLEVGKQWDQAYADITEAVDFLEYYGREMLRLEKGVQLINLPGESNRYVYESRGIAVVIAPWNFPFAISCGMCAAALVSGNTVLYKPSGLSPVTGALMADVFLDTDLPTGVFNYAPFRGAEIGDYIVEHPDINIIAFTGSKEVGLRISEKASILRSGQKSIKKVIAEMGGKNAIIVDDDADLDEAVSHVIQSAFAYQGQKCSACSRVIILNSVYDRFVHRLVEAAGTVELGPAEDPKNFMGPVIDEEAQKKIIKYIEIGKKEGRVLLSRDVSLHGFYAPLTIIGDITTDHRIAQEEIFGPVLSLMRADSFEEAVEIANSTRYALTGGVLSRSPSHLEYASKYFRVGNLYLNRGITGALVGRQPFGGFKMSGIGSKAGGHDYLLQYMEPRTVTENTMRRGFAPEHID